MPQLDHRAGQLKGSDGGGGGGAATGGGGGGASNKSRCRSRWHNNSSCRAKAGKLVPFASGGGPGARRHRESPRMARGSKVTITAAEPPARAATVNHKKKS